MKAWQRSSVPNDVTKHHQRHRFSATSAFNWFSTSARSKVKQGRLNIFVLLFSLKSAFFPGICNSFPSSLTLCSGLAWYGEEVLACPGGGQGEQEEGVDHLGGEKIEKRRRKANGNHLDQVDVCPPRHNPSSPPSLPHHPPLSCKTTKSIKVWCCSADDWKLVRAAKLKMK